MTNEPDKMIKPEENDEWTGQDEQAYHDKGKLKAVEEEEEKHEWIQQVCARSREKERQPRLTTRPQSQTEQWTRPRFKRKVGKNGDGCPRQGEMEVMCVGYRVEISSQSV